MNGQPYKTLPKETGHTGKQHQKPGSYF